MVVWRTWASGRSGSFSRGYGGLFDRSNSSGRNLSSQQRSAESRPLEAERNNTAACLASEGKAGVLDFSLKLKLSSSKPALELLFCPITARYEKSAALLREGLDLSLYPSQILRP